MPTRDWTSPVFVINYCIPWCVVEGDGRDALEKSKVVIAPSVGGKRILCHYLRTADCAEGRHRLVAYLIDWRSLSNVFLQTQNRFVGVTR